MKLKLDHLTCLTATCTPGKKRTDYWDTVTTGFVLEVRAGGSKTYALRYIDEHGKQRQHKIGGYGEITFAEAQKAAKRVRSQVVLGGDPAAKKAEKKAAVTAPGEVF